MGERIPQQLQEKLTARLRFYEDLGIGLFYGHRTSVISEQIRQSIPANESGEGETPLVKRTAVLTTLENKSPVSANGVKPDKDQSAVNFQSIATIAGETLPVIQENLGECVRCKLHKTRNKIVFGVGNPQAKLIFVGEGPGADEDEQGLPFVGRAGKLLTQMIEAMGLRRDDVYICNVVKCRPPQNRQPDRDEVEACSPFLLRQIDTIAPKVIVCLGATAAKLLLETDQGISQFRGQWMNFRGRKLMATYHPAYLLRNPAAKSEVWKDLQKVMAELGLEVKKSKPSA